MNILWILFNIFLLSLFFFIIYQLIVYLKNKSDKDKKNSVVIIILALSMGLASCDNEVEQINVAPLQVRYGSLEEQAKIISDLGFDLSKVSIDSPALTQVEAKYFQTKKDALEFISNISLQTSPTSDSSKIVLNEKPTTRSVKNPVLIKHGIVFTEFLLLSKGIGIAIPFFKYNIQMGVYHDRNNRDIKLGAFSMYVTGFHPGLSWNFQEGYQVYDPIYYPRLKSYPTAEFLLLVRENYNLIIEGIGTVFSRNIKLWGNYNAGAGYLDVVEQEYDDL